MAFSSALFVSSPMLKIDIIKDIPHPIKKNTLYFGKSQSSSTIAPLKIILPVINGIIDFLRLFKRLSEEKNSFLVK